MTIWEIVYLSYCIFSIVYTVYGVMVNPTPDVFLYVYELDEVHTITILEFKVTSSLMINRLLLQLPIFKSNVLYVTLSQ